MNRFRQFWNSLYLNSVFFMAMGFSAVLFGIGHFYELFYTLGLAAIYVSLGLLLLDIFLLFYRNGLDGGRSINPILSNGDENACELQIANGYNFSINVQVLDELPFQLGIREMKFNTQIRPLRTRYLEYKFTPMARGEYHFGNIIAMVRSPLQFIQRKYEIRAETSVAVYPSYVYLNRYNLQNFKRFTESVGIQKTRKIGHSTEFEQIKGYIIGDDIRHINWKSSAKQAQLMVNQYTEEKAKQVYSIIDTGRAMQMPFEGLSLLDYAVNACLAMSHVIVKNNDRAGLIYFNKKVEKLLPADRSMKQLPKILNALYNLKTEFYESNFENLFSEVRFKINQRSLLLIYTNFEDMNSLRRQMPYLIALAKNNVVLIVFFRNSELEEVVRSKVRLQNQFYNKAVAERLVYQKELMAKEMNKHGILTLLTSPETLTLNTINKYLEIKARGVV